MWSCRALGKDRLQRDDKIISGSTVAYGVRSRLLCGFLTAQYAGDLSVV